MMCEHKGNISIIVCLVLSFSNISSSTSPDPHGYLENTIPRPILASMTWSRDKGFELVVDKFSKSADTVGWVNFTNAINQTGWSYLEIKTNESFPDKIQVNFIIVWKHNLIYV